MLYKFKSKAAGDVVMLQQHAEALLHIIGKDDHPQGVLMPQDIPQALQALQQAALAEKERLRQAEPEAQAQHDDGRAPEERVLLAQRAWPLMHMMELSIAENREIVWGV